MSNSGANIIFHFMMFLNQPKHPTNTWEKLPPSRQKSGFKHLYFKRLGLPWFPNPLFPSPTLWGAPNPKAIGGANPGGWKNTHFFSAVKIICAQFCTIIRFNIHIYIYLCVTVIHYIYI